MAYWIQKLDDKIELILKERLESELKIWQLTRGDGDSLEFEFRIKNQSISLDPPLEYCRSYFYLSLAALIG